MQPSYAQDLGTASIQVSYLTARTWLIRIARVLRIHDERTRFMRRSSRHDPMLSIPKPFQERRYVSATHCMHVLLLTMVTDQGSVGELDVGPGWDRLLTPHRSRQSIWSILQGKQIIWFDRLLWVLVEDGIVCRSWSYQSQRLFRVHSRCR